MRNISNIRINFTAIGQYILIYLMLLIPGSCLFAKYLTSDVKYYVLICLYIFLFVINRKYRAWYSIFFSLILLFIVIFVRLITNGGVGLTAWLQFAVCLNSVQFAICCDKKNFLRRFVKLVVFFALVSIIFWLLFLIFPQAANLWPATIYITNVSGSSPEWSTTYYGKGLILYSHLEAQIGRNCGIYTEPGVYQIILNSTLFVLLFWNNRISAITRKKFYYYLFIVIFAIIACQATTGYIGCLLIIVFFLLFKKDRNALSFYSKLKTRVGVLVCIAIVALLIEYIVNKNDSIIYTQIIVKLFPDGSISLDAGTGQYRMNTLIASLQSLLKHPLGIGYDNFFALSSYNSEMVAASIASFAAIYGLIPWIIVLVFIFYPVIRYVRGYVAVLFILLFLNTTLAQTDLFYPALMLIPTYLLVTKNSDVKPVNWFQKNANNFNLTAK